MFTIGQLRGVILEEILLLLLEKAGYRLITTGEDSGIDLRGSVLYVQGRGEWHQLDAFVAYDFTPAFIYPIRLAVEAKAYLGGINQGKVGLSVVRNAVGVLKDLNENYFSGGIPYNSLKIKRYNYVYAIFSLNGFTDNAQRYALAHQIYLIQYANNPMFDGIKRQITDLRHVFKRWKESSDISREIRLDKIRKITRSYFRNVEQGNNMALYFNDDEIGIMTSLREETCHINGSYFGLLNGEYPIHLTSSDPIAVSTVEDRQRVRVFVNNDGMVQIRIGRTNLVFELPMELASILREVWGDKLEIVNFKRENISFITITGLFEGVRRNLRLELDNEWLDSYVNRLRST